ncbi:MULTISPECIES: hypothetical protein [Sporosarcina]|uniref:Uncharacterized protein n=1 Tax=Sporosarcina contaminans TaxID=633403 RepID=A0ABW3TWV1_9BACL
MKNNHETNQLQTDDIESLKEKIEGYKNLLIALKSDKTTIEPPIGFHDLTALQEQIANLEEVIKQTTDKQHTISEEYDKLMKHVAMQFRFLNRTIEEMDQEIASVKEKLIIEKANKRKSIASPLPINFSVSAPPSYHVLRNLINQANDPQEATSGQHNSLSRHQPQINEFPTKQNFPSTSKLPEHFHRNMNKRSTFHYKNSNSSVPIPFNENIDGIIPRSSLDQDHLEIKVETEAKVEKEPSPSIEQLEPPIQQSENKEMTVPVPVPAPMPTFESQAQEDNPDDKEKKGGFSIRNWFKRKNE